MKTRLVVILFIALLCFEGLCQEVGNKVRLQSTNPQGAPVHPAAGNTSYVRWANGTEGTVKAIDAAPGWFQIESQGQTGWVTKSYLVVITAPPDGDTDPQEALTYVIGTWNLEWFKDGASRGFPEYTYTPAGPHYGERTDADYGRIAGIIKTQLFAKILVLNEINGQSLDHSVEMDRLVGKLGANWAYDIGASGSGQRVAMLFDTSAVRKNKWLEIPVPQEMINGSDVFARDPSVGFFTLLDKQGNPKNDLVVVGVHLTSGQDWIQNHNKAMQILKDKLHELWSAGTIPAAERDVLIMGDFNASRYDLKKEDFWEDYDNGKFVFKTLSPLIAGDYPGTRLAGVPVMPRSQIDYILASNLPGGMFDELVQFTAQVHIELLPTDFNDFRAHVSDHLPVTVRVKVIPDDD